MLAGLSCKPNAVLEGAGCNCWETGSVKAPASSLTGAGQRGVLHRRHGLVGAELRSPIPCCPRLWGWKLRVCWCCLDGRRKAVLSHFCAKRNEVQHGSLCFGILLFPDAKKEKENKGNAIKLQSWVQQGSEIRDSRYEMKNLHKCARYPFSN